jgi:hypothetical protein
VLKVTKRQIIQKGCGGDNGISPFTPVWFAGRGAKHFSGFLSG